MPSLTLSLPTISVVDFSGVAERVAIQSNISDTIDETIVDGTSTLGLMADGLDNIFNAAATAEPEPDRKDFVVMPINRSAMVFSNSLRPSSRRD